MVERYHFNHSTTTLQFISVLSAETLQLSMVVVRRKFDGTLCHSINLDLFMNDRCLRGYIK